MKTAKKLFSLLLVAVLLFSAVPFQASAATEPEWKAIYWKADRNTKAAADGSIVNGKVVSPAAGPAEAGYTFLGWTLDGTNVIDLSTYEFKTGVMKEAKNDDGTVAFMYVDLIAKYSLDHVHTLGAPVTVDATCTTDGSITKECTAAGCTATPYKEVETIGKLGHSFNTYTADALGEYETATCDRENCNATDTRKKAYSVKFVDDKLGTTEYVTLYKNSSVSGLPERTGDSAVGFKGWFSADNQQLIPGSTWAGNYLEYKAVYEETIHTTQSKVKVYYRIYSNGKPVDNAKYLNYDIELPNNTASLLNAVNANSTGIYNTLVAKGLTSDLYQLDPAYYVYNTSNGAEQALAGNTTVNNSTAVLIKLNAKEVMQSTVIVYVHDKVEATAKYSYTMNEYTIGSTVYLSQVQSLLKSKGTNVNVTEMYSKADWNRKVNGYKNSGVNLMQVEGNLLEIHVLNANFRPGTSTSSKSASNPATGDMIEVTAAVMFLAAAAVVTLTQLRKRKVI